MAAFGKSPDDVRHSASCAHYPGMLLSLVILGVLHKALSRAWEGGHCAEDRRRRAMVLKSHREKLADEEQMLVAILQERQQEHPAIQRLTAAEPASSEIEVQDIERCAETELTDKDERRKNANASITKRRDLLRVMRTKVAAATTAEGRKAMENELIWEVARLRECRIDAGSLSSDACSDIDKLCHTMIAHYKEKCKRFKEGTAKVQTDPAHVSSTVILDPIHEDTAVSARKISRETFALACEIRDEQSSLRKYEEEERAQIVQHKARKAQLDLDNKGLKRELNEAHDALRAEETEHEQQLRDLREFIDQAPSLFNRLKRLEEAIEKAHRRRASDLKARHKKR